MLVNGFVMRKMIVPRKDRCTFLSSADASGLDAQCILALLIAPLRAERFCDGALLEFIESGAVIRWLKRLQELDEA